MSVQTQQVLRNIVIPVLLVAVAGVCLALVVYDEITRTPVDGTVQNLLAFIVGVLSNQLGSQTGTAQTQEVVKQFTNGGSKPTPVPPGSTIYTPSSTRIIPAEQDHTP